MYLLSAQARFIKTNKILNILYHLFIKKFKKKMTILKSYKKKFQSSSESGQKPTHRH